jgi:uncharacterized membrane protein
MSPMIDPVKKTENFILQTFINGVIFLIPIVAVIWIFSGAISGIFSVMYGLKDNMFAKKLGGPIFVFLIAVIGIVLLIFLTGILIHLTLLRKLNSFLEKRVLDLVPGYAFFKSMMEEKLHIKDAVGIVVLVRWNESKQLGIQTETHSDDTCTVYFPHSSITGGGSVHIVDKSRIQILNLSLNDLDNIFNQFGANLGSYLN